MKKRIIKIVLVIYVLLKNFFLMVYKLLSPIYWGVSVLRNTYFYFRENQRPIKSKNFFFY